MYVAVVPVPEAPLILVPELGVPEYHCHVNVPVPPVAVDVSVIDPPEVIEPEDGCTDMDGAALTVMDAVAVETKGVMVPVSVTFSHTLYVPDEDWEKEYVDDVPTTVELPPMVHEYENLPDPPVTVDVRVMD